MTGAARSPSGRPSGCSSGSPGACVAEGRLLDPIAAGASDRIVPQHLVLVLPSTGEFDSRSWRIARSLTERGHRVTVLARWKEGLPVEEDHPAGFRLVRIRTSASGAAAASTSSASWLGRTWHELRRRIGILRAMRSHRQIAVRDAPAGDLYHGMAFMGIPVALDLGKRDGVPVVYDARDIYLSARNVARMGRLARGLLGRFERGWAERASRVVTVNDAYADVMARRWPVERPLVVMNCSFRFEPPSPRVRRFHDHLGLDAATKVVLYHGGFSPWRGIEQLLDAIRLVPGATLVLMGYGALEDTLKAREADPANGSKVRVMTAVPPGELHDWVAAADVAAMPIQGDTLNHRLTTPNKLFEAMAAGVPAVVSDLPGMRSIVEDAGSGILVDPADVRAIAAAILRIVELPESDWLEWRQRCLEAAHDRYNWEAQVQRLVTEYGRLTGKPW